MHSIRRLLTTAAAVAAVLATVLSAAPPAPAVTSAVALCASTWQAVQKVAVRRPAWNDGPVATPRSPIVRYLRQGEWVRSCVVGVGRDASAYRECGGGTLWRIVPGGQVPATCLRRA
ncbi:hypothetical protein ABT278_35740 [Streptomyces sp. NPDC001228]|uniref:hypothetical protein n=1 Tax=Streptomyces sp. NPDC001228 TaxID=3154381 RepID=UPI003328E657